MHSERKQHNTCCAQSLAKTKIVCILTENVKIFQRQPAEKVYTKTHRQNVQDTPQFTSVRSERRKTTECAGQKFPDLQAVTAHFLRPSSSALQYSLHAN